MELSKMKNIQRYMIYFEIYFRRFGRQPKSDQLSIIFTPSMEVIFDNIETADVGMNPYHSTIKPIIKRNFGNKFHHHNGSDQRQNTNKNASNQYNNSNTRQRYQHRNNVQQHQHRNPSQRYQPI